MRKALFFDLDGTLWDALKEITASYNETMIRLNKPYHFLVGDLISIMGLTPEETVNLIFKNEEKEEGLKLFNICFKDEVKYLYAHPGTPYAHLKDVLSNLKKTYDLFIVSNADKGYVESFLTSLDMKEYFKDYVQAGDTNLAKWQNIIYLSEKYNIDRKDIIYIGDTLKDMKESAKANVKFIHASYGFGKIDEPCFKIENLDQLELLAQKIFSE